MSAFFDQASLVVVPSGYKSGKIYAQKPLTTDGQLTFSRASTATRVNSAGLIETVSSNVPRLDYLNSSCPRLLLEPQRTNLATYSEQFDNSTQWPTKANITLTANQVSSPDGYTNADSMIDNAVAGEHYILSAAGITSGAGTFTYSIFAKYNGGQWFAIYSNVSGIAYFDIQNGVIGTVSNGTATIEAYANGWYRCTLTAAQASSSRMLIAGASANGVLSYTPSGTTGRYIWGAQVEAGAYATSYIPTTSAAVTRLADACSKTGISSLIGQTEGTLFAEIEVLSNTDNFGIWLRLSGSLYQNTIIIYTNSSRQPRAEINVGGALQVLISGAALSVGYHKLAFAYKANDFAFYVDGTQIGTSNSGSVPACDDIYIDQYIDGGVRNATKKQALLFKTRLTNAQLAELTAL